MAAAPPRLAAALAARCVRGESWQHDVLGDLHEEFLDVANRRGRASASRWFWRQTLRLAAAAASSRARTALRAFAVLMFIGDRPMHAFVQELRSALRSLGRRRGVTAAIMFTLAIGLGVNAAIFNSIDRLLLKPFAFKDIDRMVMASELATPDDFPKESVSPASFLEIAVPSTTMTGVAAYGWGEVNLSGGAEPQRIAAFTISSEFFSILGVAPAMGRLFSPGTDVWGQQHEIVLSDALWRSRFGADANIIGRTLHIDSEPATVVGVAPAGFSFPEGAEAWTPLAFDPKERTNRTSRYLTVFGRIAPGRSLHDVQSELSARYEQARAEHPDELRGHTMHVTSLTLGMVDVGMPTILALWQAAAVLVLLIGCTNVVNLLLAQGAERQRELAVRLALGASRARIVRQLVIESLVLSLASVPAALGVAWLTLALMKAAMPAALIRFVPGWDKMSVDGWLMLWTTLAAAATGALFGLLPAIHASRSTMLAAVSRGGDGSRTQTASAGKNRARRALVVAELALALPLLMASALAVSAVQKFVTGAQGYDPNGVVRATLTLPSSAYKDDAAIRVFTDRLIDEAARATRASALATGSILPASGTSRSRDLVIDGRPIDKEHPAHVNFRIVSPQYFETLRIPILSGRAFNSTDRESGQQIAIISQSLANKFFPGESPVGRRLRINAIDHDWITIAGVSGDVIDDWFANRNVPTIYVPAAQVPSRSVTLAVRSAADVDTVVAGIQRALKSIDPDVPAYQVRTMNAALKERTIGLRFIGGLMAAFGGIALVLAAIGIYSVMSFYVTLRRKEMGLRLALGASPGDVLRMTLGQASRLSLTGIAIGFVFALAAARVLEKALLGTSKAEPSMFAAVSLVLLGVATLASAIPARAATKVDPSQTLRD